MTPENYNILAKGHTNKDIIMDKLAPSNVSVYSHIYLYYIVNHIIVCDLKKEIIYLKYIKSNMVSKTIDQIINFNTWNLIVLSFFENRIEKTVLQTRNELGVQALTNL